MILCLGLRGRRPSDLFLEYDERMRPKYVDPIEHFPDKVDQLLAALDRVSIVLLGFPTIKRIVSVA